MNNYKTTLTGIAAALTSILTILAALPYQLGDLATIIPPEWKARVVIVGLVASTVLKVMNSVYQQNVNKLALTRPTPKKEK